MRTASWAVVATLALPMILLSGCMSEPEDPYLVQMIGVQFNPKVLTVPVNTTVTWQHFDGSVPHTVTPVNATLWGTPGSGDSPDDYLYQGETWQWTFTEPGTYDYYCIPHAGAMRATIIVE